MDAARSIGSRCSGPRPSRKTMKYLIIALTLLWAPAHTHAELITFGFSGGAWNIFDINAVAFRVNGYYTFDSDALGSVNTDGNVKIYPALGLTFSYLGYTQVIDGVNITVKDFGPFPVGGPGQDRYSVGSTFISNLDPWFALTMVACFDNPFTSTDLPLTIDRSLFRGCSDPDDVPQINFNTGNIRGHGGLTSISRVPESSSWLLFVTGMILISIKRHVRTLRLYIIPTRHAEL
jgi:hypothetical protein